MATTIRRSGNRPVAEGSRGIAVSEAARTLSNTDKFKLDFLTTIAASVGIIMVRTREPMRAASVLQEVITEFNEFDMHFRMWDPVNGTQEYRTPFEVQGGERVRNEQIQISIYKSETKIPNTVDILLALNRMNEDVNPSLMVMHGFINSQQNLFTDKRVQHYIRLLSHKSLLRAHRYVFIVPEGTVLPVEIENEIHVIDFRVPSHSELVRLFPHSLKGIPDGSYKPHFTEPEIDMLAQAAKGMSEMEFLNACAIALMTLTENFQFDDHRPIKDEDELGIDDFIKVISDFKMEMVKRTDVLELLPSADMDAIGGYDLLKKWIQQRRSHYSDDAHSYGLKPPKGIIAVGIPGSGKSQMAKAIGGVLGLPILLFNFSRIFGKFVGESEGRMQAALKRIDAMAPCVLFVDEIDKAMGGAGGNAGDSGTTSRVFGSWLTWLQERDNINTPVFVVATANNVAGIPAEMLRPGRFDAIFKCLFPSAVDRKEIFRIKIREAGHGDAFGEDDYRKMAIATDQYVGGEIEQAVANALGECFDAGLEHPTTEAVIAAAEAIVPFSKAFKDKLEPMFNWANAHARPSSSDKEFEDAPTQPRTSRTLMRPAGIRKPVGKRLDDR